MGVGVCMAVVAVPRPPACAGGPAWAGGKPSGRQFSPQPALRVCLHPISVALALVLILGLWVGTQLLCNLARQECGGM